MPLCSTRSIASRATFCWSTSFSASSWMRMLARVADAHLLPLRACRRRGRGSMSFTLTPISSTPCGVKISNDGKPCSLTSISISRSSSFPSSSQRPSFSRVSVGESSGSGAATNAGRARGGRESGRRRSRMRSRALRSAVLADHAVLLVLDELHADLGEVADDRLDVAADVADLGELRRLDLEERRAGEPRQAARDLGFADAGRADHDDVLRRDLVAQLGRELLPPPAIAQRDGDRALRGALADDVLVELAHDLLGREALGVEHGVVDGPGRWMTISEALDRDVVVRVDADLGGDAHRFLGDLARRSSWCASSARAPRRARTSRRSRWRGCRRRAESDRRCRRSDRRARCWRR